MAFELPEEVYSPQILEMIIYELEQYNDWYQKTKISSKVGVKPTDDEPNHSVETGLVLGSWQKTKAKQGSTVHDLVTELKELKLPVVHITLAALPNHAQRAQLVRWFDQLGQQRPLIQFGADRTLGGGVVIRTPNHIYDWSFRLKIDEARSNLGKVVANA